MIFNKKVLISLLFVFLLFTLLFLTSCSSSNSVQTSSNSLEDIKNNFGALKDILTTLQIENQHMQQKLQNIEAKHDERGKDVAILKEKIEQNQKDMKTVNDFTVAIKTDVEKMNNGMVQIGAMSTQIDKIHRLYDNSKNRGNIGEIQLQAIIGNYFGENQKDIWQMQASVDGGIIDCLIKVGNKEIYIDSKFNKDNWEKYSSDRENIELLNNFKKDVTTMVNDLTKYNHEVIMFVPSERIYADIVEIPGLLDFAYKNRIIFAGPATLIHIIAISAQNYNNLVAAKDLDKKVEMYRKFINERWNTWAKNWHEFIDAHEKYTNKIKNLTNATKNIVTDAKLIEKGENKKLLEETAKTLNDDKNSLTSLKEVIDDEE